MIVRLQRIGIRAVAMAAVLLFSITVLATSIGPWVQQTSAAGCAAPSIVFGRWKWCGYWFNRYDSEGDSVRIGGVPGWVDDAEDYINLIASDRGSGNRNHMTGASFVILTMIGASMPWPAYGWANSSTTHPQADNGQFNEWARRMRTYANLGTWGGVSHGTNGTIEWWGNQHLACGTGNTYWQGNFSGVNPDDVAPYVMEPGNSSCANPWVMDSVIVFRDTSGNEVYKIRRNCMNPLGTLSALSPQAEPSFNVAPTMSVSQTEVEIGDSVTFTYGVVHSGDPADNINCTALARAYSGYQPDPASLDPAGGAGVALGCPRTINGSTTLATENVTLSTANQTVCRSLVINPTTFNGGASSPSVACVHVVTKPYSRAFNGDVQVGNGFASVASPGSCTTNNNASVLGWNKRNGSYDGAGTRGAVMAMGLIYDYASAQNSTGAAVPKGLSFGNPSSNVASGWFGGGLGTASCIPDYFGARPTANETWTTNVSSMSDANGGIYYSNGSATISGGNVNGNSRISVYVEGDLYITGDITYPNNFNLSSMPLFQVVVKGNIYINNGVGRLDGIYIAQPSGGSNGRIYTCTNTAYTPLSPSASNFYSLCNNKLTVNGSFIAREIWLQRTAGSLKNASAGETAATSNAGEVFNYGPAFWLQQPRGGTSSGSYDSITSLPPIL